MGRNRKEWEEIIGYENPPFPTKRAGLRVERIPLDNPFGNWDVCNWIFAKMKVIVNTMVLQFQLVRFELQEYFVMKNIG